MGVFQRFLAVLVVPAAVTLTASPAIAEKRVALVIGNDRYANLAGDKQLNNAINDARAVKLTLEGLGFNVLYGENLDRRALVDRLFDLTARLSVGDTAFFYFAGHGVSLSGANYLLPSDIPTPHASGRAEEGRIADQAIAETQVIERITASGARVAIVVLDACRDNPLQGADRRSLGGTRGLGHGQPARGVFSIYSAGFGQAALDRLGPDDRNPNSVFTRVFVDKLKTPGLDLKEVASETRRLVVELAEKVGHEQFPAYYDQIIGGDVYLAGLPTRPKDGPQPPRIDPCVTASEHWQSAAAIGTRMALEDHLSRFPNCAFAGLAKARIESLKTAAAAPPVRPTPPPVVEPAQPAVGVFSSARAPTPLTVAEEHALKPKDSFKECDRCPEMVVVPAGTFTMGSPESEKERLPTEGPQHQVTFAKPFAVGRFAVTFDEWDACVAGDGCNGYKPADQGWGRGWRPVINVSWDDAKAYAAWLSRKTGKTYRLLSEAEREYVTRAGTTTPFWWGATMSPEQANYSHKGTSVYGRGTKGEGRQKTVSVDSFKANPWGLYQVHGNVLEWTEDCNNDSYRGAPTDGAAWTSGRCSSRIVRGGSWGMDPGGLRSAYRRGLFSEIQFEVIGFRVARTLTP